VNKRKYRWSSASVDQTTEVEIMDKDRIKGTMDDAAGRVKRQVGEWTGDTNAQVEGTAQQIKGKTEKAVGQVKDAVRDMDRNNRTDADREREREREQEHQHTHP
jgi:uncharacterized protein YjbJ (UPF0337 family)